MKRYVEVKRIRGHFHTHSGEDYSLSDLISQVPDIENKIREVLIESRKYTHEQLNKAGIKGTPELYIEHQVFSILQLFKESEV